MACTVVSVAVEAVDATVSADGSYVSRMSHFNTVTVPQLPVSS